MNRDTWEATLREHRRWLLPLVLLAVAVPYTVRAAFRPRSAERGDTRFYVQGAGRYWRGADLYYDREALDLPEVNPASDPVPTTGYTYLPPFAAAFGWTVLIPYRALRVVWLALMLACGVAAVAVAWRMAQPRPPPEGRPHLVVLLALLVVARFGLNDLAHGQVNWLITLLLGLTLLHAQRDKPARAGAWLGVALLIKPTSWLLVPWYLFVDRRPRLVATCLSVFAGAVLLAGARYGLGDYMTQLADWGLRMTRFAGESSQVPHNASLAAVLTRLGAGVEIDGAVEPLLFSWPLAAVQVGARWSAGGLVALGFLALAYTRRRSPAAPAVVVLLGALLSPVTWKGHLVGVLLAACFVARDLAERSPSGARWAAFAALAGMLVLPTHSASGLDTLQACGVVTLGLVVLAGWAAWSWPGPRDPEPPAPPALE